MTLLWPEAESPAVDAPLADVVLYRVLNEHPALAEFGLTVDLPEQPSARALPWLRTGTVRYLEPSRPGEQTPIGGIDVYADSLLDAAVIAGRIAALWPLLRKVEIPGEGFISGAWVETDPYILAEPDLAGTGETPARYHLEVGLRLHPSPSGA